MNHPLGRRLAVIALAGGLLFAACGDDEPDAEFSAQDDDSSSLSDGKDDTKTDDGSDETTTDGDTIGVDFPDPDDVVADATFTIPGTDGDEVRVGVAGILATDSYTELRLVFTPLYEPDRGVPSVYDMLGENTRQWSLIDRGNLKEYRVLQDQNHSDYATDAVGAKADTGESVIFQVFFAPPEDDIDVVDVVVQPAWPAFEDVPITYEG